MEDEAARVRSQQMMQPTRGVGEREWVCERAEAPSKAAEGLAAKKAGDEAAASGKTEGGETVARRVEESEVEAINAQEGVQARSAKEVTVVARNAKEEAKTGDGEERSKKGVQEAAREGVRDARAARKSKTEKEERRVEEELVAERKAEEVKGVERKGWKEEVGRIAGQEAATVRSVGEEAVVKGSAEEAEVEVEKGEGEEGARKVGEGAAAVREAEEEAAVAMKAEEATRAARRIDPGGMAGKRAKEAGVMVKQARDAAWTEAVMETKTEKTKAVTETKADKREGATKVEEATAAQGKTMGGRALMCSDRRGAGANHDEVRKQMLDAGSTPRPLVAGLACELEAEAKTPGGAVKAGHAPKPSDLAGRGCTQGGVGSDFLLGLDPVGSDTRSIVSMQSRPTAGSGAVSKQTWKQKVKAGSSLTPPGPASEQESEVKAQEPTDQVEESRTINAAREALVAEERAQQKTLTKLRFDQAKITAAEVQLKEEKEKSARRVLELERGIERLQAARAQLDKDSALVCRAGSTAMVCTIPRASGKGAEPRRRSSKASGRAGGAGGKVKAQGLTISNGVDCQRAFERK